MDFSFSVFSCIASPVSIPPRSCATHRPMRSSVEGLNQEIEKLVLIPGQQHSCRPESSHVRNTLYHFILFTRWIYVHPLLPSLSKKNYYLFFLFKFTRGIPEGHRAPLADILHSDTRSVNTQTPNRDLLSSGKLMKIFFFVREFGDLLEKPIRFIDR